MKALHALFSLPLIVTALLAAGPALAQDNWLTTWMASPQPTWGNELPLPTRIPEALADSTIHQKLRVSVGGSQVRVVVSNEYGKQPLLIGAARVAASEGARQVLKFGGEEQVSIAPGETRTSDPAALVVPALGDLVVSLYLPQRTPLATFHWDGKQTAFIAPGNQVDAQRLEGKEQVEARLFISDILVDARSTAERWWYSAIRLPTATARPWTATDAGPTSSPSAWPPRTSRCSTAAYPAPACSKMAWAPVHWRVSSATC